MAAFATIIVKNKVNYAIAIFLSLWLIAWFAGFLIMSYSLLQYPGRLDGLLIILYIVMVLAGFGVLNVLLWQFRGKETLSINNKALIIEKTGTMFKKHKAYELNFIDDFYSANHNFKNSWCYTGNRGGKIGFTYLGDAKYFGQSLTVQEVNRHIPDLKEVISQRNK